MNTPNPEQIIEEFLEGDPRADLWRDLRQALEERLRDAVTTLDMTASDDPDRAPQEQRVAELREQVAALAQEEAITQFVEDSVRASLNRPVRPGAFLDEFGDEDY